MCCRRSSDSFFDSESSVAVCESPPPCAWFDTYDVGDGGQLSLGGGGGK